MDTRETETLQCMDSSTIPQSAGGGTATGGTATDGTATARRHVGQVKWFDKVKGFGFISNLDDMNDYFVHHTQIRTAHNDDNQRELFRYLIAGEYVQFELREVTSAPPTSNNGETRVMASNVSGIRNGPLMYNIIHQQHQERHAFHRDKYGEEQELDNEGDNDVLRNEAVMEDGDDDGFTQVRRRRRRLSRQSNATQIPS